VLQLIMDSLRYWVLEMHVDGFRFDLASALARELHEVDKLAAFFDIIHQDPVLSQVKLIAEPWDLGEGGYQVGNFPVGWTEWNGKYRDCVRRFWRATAGPGLGVRHRLSGSSDLYEERPPPLREHQLRHLPRRLHAARSRELQREAQRGQRRREPRRREHNDSWNCGVEGPTDDPIVRAARRRSGTSWPRCSSRRVCPCCWPATNSVARSRATTTPTARTTN
jgi:isoamylase